jgi:hypothetical protein
MISKIMPACTDPDYLPAFETALLSPPPEYTIEHLRDVISFQSIVSRRLKFETGYPCAVIGAVHAPHRFRKFRLAPMSIRLAQNAYVLRA